MHATRIATVLSLSLVGATLSSDAAAQSRRNVELLSRTDLGGGRVSDVWGWVEPGTGREFALVGSMSGVHVVDCSDPRNPRQTGLIPTDRPGSSGNRWQDIKAYGSYAYVVSEAYGGMQVIDLTDPDRPSKVTTFGAGLWSSSHNIALDQGTGIVYVCGTSNGTHAIDVATNPGSPTRLGVLTSPYVHDLAVQDGLAHVAEINANRFRIYDVTALPNFAQVSSTSSAGRSSCHSMWPSRDNQVLAICHETSGGELTVYDISTPRLPILTSVFQTGGPSAIVHNPMVVDRVCHVSWNTEGYQALDLSDPRQPVRVGHYDTWTGASAGFEGMWGVFATQPSGVVYGGDRTAGLFVFKPVFTLARYGAAVSGEGGIAPRLHAFGAAYRGNARHRLDVASARPQSVGVMLLGVARGAGTGALPLHVDLNQLSAAIPFVTDTAGEARIALPVPASAGEAQLYAQALVQDPSAVGGVAASQGGAFGIFGL